MIVDLFTVPFLSIWFVSRRSNGDALEIDDLKDTEKKINWLIRRENFDKHSREFSESLRDIAKPILLGNLDGKKRKSNTFRLDTLKKDNNKQIEVKKKEPVLRKLIGEIKIKKKKLKGIDKVYLQ